MELMEEVEENLPRTSQRMETLGLTGCDAMSKCREIRIQKLPKVTTHNNSHLNKKVITLAILRHLEIV